MVDAVVSAPRPNLLPNAAVPTAITGSSMPPKKRLKSPRQAATPRKDRVSVRDRGARRLWGATRGPFSVNKSPDGAESNANFESVDSCKQKPQSSRLSVAPTMKQPQPQVVRDSKDMTMSAVINRGGGRPSKGLRKYIGFRTQAKTAEDVQMIAAAKGMTVTDYVSSAVDRSLREDLALLDHFALQEELPIRIAS